MRFLILAALVAVAAADYHDETFHFSTLGSASGLQKSSGFLAASPILAKKLTTFAAPAVARRFTAVQQAPVYAAVKSVQQYAAVQPAFSQQYTVSQVAQPAVFAQQYSAQPSYAAAGPQFRILSQVQESDPAGPYKLSYATENGIQASEQGALVAGAEGAVVAAQGSYSYTGPDGQVYTVSYIADENGFRASGDHLPTPPPIPAEILRSLEENAASGERYDDQGRLFRK